MKKQSKYQEFKDFLNQNLSIILRTLPQTEFSSKDFITSVKAQFPDFYKKLLKTSGTFRNAHRWVARHYLSNLPDTIITKIDKKKSIKTQFDNDSRNQLWKRLK